MAVKIPSLALVYAAEPRLGEETVVRLFKEDPRQFEPIAEEVLSLHGGIETREMTKEIPIMLMAAIAQFHLGTIESLADRIEALEERFGMDPVVIHPGCKMLGNAAWHWTGYPLFFTTVGPLLGIGAEMLSRHLAHQSLLPEQHIRFFVQMSTPCWTPLLGGLFFWCLNASITTRAGLGKPRLKLKLAMVVCGWRNARREFKTWNSVVLHTTNLLRGRWPEIR